MTVSTNNVDNILNESTTNFVGKDGFYWWIGEVEDNEDPLQIGRVKCRVLNYYTTPKGGTATELKTEDLPWATVLQPTDQAGSWGLGKSSGWLQPGAIVMGFFMDGQDAQMPLVMGVMRSHIGYKKKTKKFIFSSQEYPDGVSPNPATLPPGESNVMENNTGEPPESNSVSIGPQNETVKPGSFGAPFNNANKPGQAGSSSNPQKPRSPKDPIPAANGVGGPYKTMEYQLGYLIEDISTSASQLVKTDNGDFIDVVEGKLVTMEKLTGKMKNYLGALFSQVISAMRMQLDDLVQKIEKASFKNSFTGVPNESFKVVEQALQALLGSICGLDAQLASLISSPISTIEGLIKSQLNGVLSKAQMATEGLEKTLDSIVCSVQSMLSNLSGILKTVKGLVSGQAGIGSIMEKWASGTGIMDEKFDINEIATPTGSGAGGLFAGILALFFTKLKPSCDRSANNGGDNVGWQPFFGTTACTPAELANLRNLLGSDKGSCENGKADQGGGGGFLDSFMAEADPYLTDATNYVSGAYETQMGTPGRQATITKKASGSTFHSIKQNNAQLAQYKAKQEARKKNPDISDKDLADFVRSQTKKATGGNSETDEGNLVADHSTYAGNHTLEVHGDECKTVDGDYCRTIEGDYRLHVTGDMHVTVGGMMAFNAQGAAKQVDKNGKKAGSAGKIQKHQVSFGSDVDLQFAGSGLKLNLTNFELGARDMVISGSSFKSTYKTQTYSPGEFVVNAGNAITFNACSLTENLNYLDPKAPAGGRFSNVGGPINWKQIESQTSKIPPFSITTPGPYMMTCAAGGATHTVEKGGYTIDVEDGAYAMDAKVSATMNATDGPMTLTAKKTMKLVAKTIYLN